MKNLLFATFIISTFYAYGQEKAKLLFSYCNEKDIRFSVDEVTFKDDIELFHVDTYIPRPDINALKEFESDTLKYFSIELEYNRMYLLYMHDSVQKTYKAVYIFLAGENSGYIGIIPTANMSHNGSLAIWYDPEQMKYVNNTNTTYDSLKKYITYEH